MSAGCTWLPLTVLPAATAAGGTPGERMLPSCGELDLALPLSRHDFEDPADGSPPAVPRLSQLAGTGYALPHLQAFLALGSVFLVVTGGEALYADMEHFGRRPIQVGWAGS